MLTTRQKTLRKFWYATVRLDALRDGPLPFRLMGADIVLFPDAEGQPAALADRCCHRTGALARIPQFDQATIRHIIINCATPIDDGRIQLVQLLYCNDTEADCPEQVLGVDRRIEQHMPSDRPGMIVRRRLPELLRSQGEEEVTREYA